MKELQKRDGVIFTRTIAGNLLKKVHLNIRPFEVAAAALITDSFTRDWGKSTSLGTNNNDT